MCGRHVGGTPAPCKHFYAMLQASSRRGSCSNPLHSLLPRSSPQMDAGMSVGCVLAGREGHVGGDLLTELSLLAPTSLPEALRDVLVDLAELQPLRWPNGALQELGSGGRWVLRGDGERHEGGGSSCTGCVQIGGCVQNLWFLPLQAHRPLPWLHLLISQHSTARHSWPHAGRAWSLIPCAALESMPRVFPLLCSATVYKVLFRGEAVAAKVSGISV